MKDRRAPTGREGSRTHKSWGSPFLAGPIAVSLLFLVAVLVELHSGLLSGQLLFAPDSEFVLRVLPVRVWFFDCLHGHAAPFWNPFLLGGVPVVEGLDASVFYPPVWLHAVLPSVPAANLLLILHLLIAACGAAYLLRAMGSGWWGACVAGLAYCMSGSLLMGVTEGRCNDLMAAAWGPFLFASLLRIFRRQSAFLLGGAALGAMLLTGGFRVAEVQLAGAAAFFLIGSVLNGRHANAVSASSSRSGSFLQAVAVLALGLGLSAAQWLPFVSYWPNAWHLSPFDEGPLLSVSLPWERLLGLLFPRLFVPFGEGAPEVFFLGAVALTLIGVAVWSLRSRVLRGEIPTWLLAFFAAALAVSLMLGFGGASPFCESIRRLIPLAALPRSTDFLCLASLCGSVLAGCGAEVLVAMPPERLRRAWQPILFVSFVLFVVFLLLFYPVYDKGDHWRIWTDHLMTETPGFAKPTDSAEKAALRAERFGEFAHDVAKAIPLIALFACAIATAGYWGRLRRFLGPALVALVLIDALDYAVPQVRVTSPDAMRWPEATESALRERQGTQWRFSVDNAAHDTAFGNYAGIRVTYASQPLAPRDVLRLWNLDQGGDADLPAPFLPASKPTPFLNRWSVRWVLSDKSGPAADTAWAPVGDLAGERLYESPNALPRARFTTSAAEAGSAEEALLRIDEGGEGATIFLSREDLALAERQFGRALPANPSSKWQPVEITVDEPTRIVLSGNFITPGYVVLADVAQPGWRALVNGAKAELLTVDGAMRGVAVKEGRHEIEMIYAGTGAARCGRWLSLCALVVFALWAGGGWVYNRRRAGEAKS